MISRVHNIWLMAIVCMLVCSSTQSTTEVKTEQAGTEPVKYIYFVFTPQCYHSLIEELNITDFKCAKLVLSKALGYSLVAGGAIVKVPQIIKILLEKSVYGIAFQSVLAEAMTNWVTIVYSWYRGNPFSIYGENAFLLGQNVIIMVLFIVLGRNVPKGVVAPGPNIIRNYQIMFLAFATTMFLTYNPLLWPKVLIDYCMVLQISLFSFARISQILYLYKQKTTGSLALATCLLLWCGNLGRLFTVLVEIGNDYMFAVSISLATLLNGTILFQFFLYRKGKGDSKSVQGKKEK